MLSSYFLQILTGNDYPHPEDYDLAAGSLINMVVSLLSNPETLDQLTDERTHTKSSVEVGLEQTDRGRELVAKIVLDIDGPAMSRFDKPKWTKILKARPESDAWTKPKILKTVVPQS